MKKYISLISVLLIIVTILTMTPLSAFADSIQIDPASQENFKYDYFECARVTEKGSGDIVLIGRYYGNATDVEIPSTINGLPVREILAYGFQRKRHIKSVSIPETVKYIENGAFNDCPALESITVSKDNKYYSSKDGVLYNKDKSKLLVYPAGKNATTFKIPKSVSTIESYAFNRCKKLTNLTIPSKVRKIEPDAFYSCTGMKKITVDKANKKYSSSNGVLFDKKKKILISYPAGKTDKSYKIPKSVVKINDYAFVSSKIAKLYMPKSVRCIGYFDGEEASKFHNCKKLKDVYYSGSKNDWKKIYFYSLEYHGDLQKEYYEGYGGKSNKNVLERVINNGAGKKVKFHYNAKF